MLPWSICRSRKWHIADQMITYSVTLTSPTAMLGYWQPNLDKHIVPALFLGYVSFHNVLVSQKVLFTKKTKTDLFSDFQEGFVKQRMSSTMACWKGEI